MSGTLLSYAKVKTAIPSFISCKLIVAFSSSIDISILLVLPGFLSPNSQVTFPSFSDTSYSLRAPFVIELCVVS